MYHNAAAVGVASQYVATRHNCVLSKQPIKECKLHMNDKKMFVLCTITLCYNLKIIMENISDCRFSPTD